MLGQILDHDPFRSFLSERIKRDRNPKLARDRTENRQPLFLIAPPKSSTLPGFALTANVTRGKEVCHFVAQYRQDLLGEPGVLVEPGVVPPRWMRQRQD